MWRDNTTQLPESLNITDTHLHCWQLGRFDYAWLSPDNPTLYQDRMPDDVRSSMNDCEVSHAVLVQAAGTPEEIPWMIGLCQEYNFLSGVVGYIDLANPHAPTLMAGFARDQRFKGIRLNLPFAPRQRQLIDSSLTALGQIGLSCDLLMSAIHLPLAIDIIQAHPETTFILDHFTGHRLRIGGSDDYADAIRALVPLQNAHIKISGFLTANDHIPLFTMAQTLSEYIDESANLLGSDRLLYGSDWPICTRVADYQETVRTLLQAIKNWPASDRDMILHGTARRVYKLS